MPSAAAVKPRIYLQTLDSPLLIFTFILNDDSPLFPIISKPLKIRPDPSF